MVVNHSYGPGYGLLLYDGTQIVALLLGQLLGIVQERVAEIGREYYRCGVHGSCQASAPGFIASGFDATLNQIGLQR